MSERQRKQNRRGEEEEKEREGEREREREEESTKPHLEGIDGIAGVETDTLPVGVFAATKK